MEVDPNRSLRVLQPPADDMTRRIETTVWQEIAPTVAAESVSLELKQAGNDR